MKRNKYRDNSVPKIKVAVTAEHIAQGKPCKSGHCPIALSINELGYNVIIGTNDVLFWEVEASAGAADKCTDIVRLPQKAQDFIRDFDASRDTGKLPKPIKFTLPLIRENGRTVSHYLRDLFNKVNIED